MNIKKVDDKPMVIHTKEKTKLYVKTAPETKIKAGNVLTVERTPKFAGAEREAKADNMDKRMSALKVKFSTKDSNGKADAEKRLSDKIGQSAQSSSVKSKSVKEDIKKSMQKENSKYAQFEKSKQDREKAIGKKKGSTVSTLASVGAKTSLDQMEGGSEVYESYMVARNLSRPVDSATDAGRRLYRTQAAKAKEKRIKKVQAGKKISKKAAGEASVLTDAEKQGIASSQQAAKLTLSQSADSLEEAKAGIQAEFDGIVTSTEVAAGSAVQEGAPMFSIADASKMCVDFKVSKYNLTSLQVGQKVTITSLDRKYQGSVTNIGKVAEKTEQGAAMATARVHIDNPDDNLIIGLDAKLKIELGKKTDVLKVPIAAVNSDSKGDFVYVFSKDKLQKKYVKTGISYKKNIEIIEGLKEGEKVVTTIDTTIEDGMKAAEKK